ncbi:Ger(x)C family spore germination protein [Cohnella fermenti]|uniref:Ger(X)C family spore germination protein n=1 Tax=Cohnella fermenti TaxID=2565925 RepID=A0A4S4BWH3_9BACL|nr:Ger(x)C family spore germination protein [Cohnella fermenti]THF79526.1 Ger(x)C family spore germination protein [Cohnella fermenti]
MKLRRRFGALALLAALVLLPGCSNSHDVQNMAYVTAIGLDYADNKYKVYLQILNFNSVAKTENPNVGRKIPIWVGHGEGDTLSRAFTSVSETSQLRMFWGHVKVIFLTDRILRESSSQPANSINRNREIRYNIYLFGTKENLDDILSEPSLLDLSPLDTLAYNGSQAVSERFFTLPMTGNRFVSLVSEPGDAAWMPSVELEQKSWTEDEKPKKMFRVSGSYFFRKGKMTAWLPDVDAVGMRWKEKGLEGIPLRVPAAGKPLAVVNVMRPEYKATPVLEGGDVRFDIRVKAAGFIYEIFENRSVADIERETAKVIKEEIEMTFRKGAEQGCDPFGLRQTLYRTHPRVFKSLSDKKGFILTKESLRNVNVTVHIRNIGKLKGRVQ